MECATYRAIIAGTSFGMLLTALRDDIDIPDRLPEVIPLAWLDNLDRYNMTLMLSTSPHKARIVASTTPEAPLKIMRKDSSHYFVNIPAAATEHMEPGEIVLTIELRDKSSNAVVKAERRTLPLIRTREIRP